MRNRICSYQNLFFPKILDQEGLKRCAVVERVGLIRWLSPIHRKVAVHNADAIIDDFVALRKIIAASVFVDGAAAAEFGEFFDEPGQRVLIGGLVANRDVNLNANLWREAGQGASFSIQKYSSSGDETRHLRHQ